jgi:cystathionine gamma-synthase
MGFDWREVQDRWGLRGLGVGLSEDFKGVRAMADKARIASRLAQGMHFQDPITGAIVPPIHLAATFARGVSDYEYGRGKNPTNTVLEAALAELDGGAESRTFASGMTAAVTILETVRTGQHVVAPHVMYNGIKRWLHRLEATRGVDVTFVDMTNLEAVREALRPGQTALLWTEAVINPTMDVVDIQAIADVVHQAGAQLVVDATFTPAVTLPALALGADFVMQSATKYLNGHSDVLAGVVTVKAPDARWAEMEAVRNMTGGVLHPFDAWLVLRGLRTLPLRFVRASETALTLARRLAEHPQVERVRYPGLEDDPGHRVAERQFTGGYGGMMAILVKGGADAAARVAECVQLAIRATSLGSVETLVEHRYPLEHEVNPAVPPNLIRVSVGIEDPVDLLADLEQALAQK